MKKLISICLISLCFILSGFTNEESNTSSQNGECGYAIEYSWIGKQYVGGPSFKITNIYRWRDRNVTGQSYQRVNDGWFWRKNREEVSDKRRDLIDWAKDQGMAITYKQTSDKCQ